MLLIGEHDTPGADHLQEEIPNEVMSFLDFIEKENAFAMWERTVPRRLVWPTRSR